MRSLAARSLLAVAVVFAFWSLCPAQATSQPAVVSNIKVLSDKVQDVSSLEAWKSWCIKDGMTDAEKAMAIFKTEVTFQVADAPTPREFLHRESDVLDPVKLWNVYGYTYCSVSAANVACMARYAGLKARNLTIQNHVVPEIWHDGAWHMYDADLIGYFPKADGSIASIQEMADGIQAWAKDHPDFPLDLKGKQARYKWMQKNKWKTEGPEILSRNPYYDANGWLPDGSFAWADTMQQFSKIANTWQSAYSMGYQVNIQLRPGEKLTRNWSNKGLHANMDGGGKPPASLNGKIGEKNFKYLTAWGDLAPGRIGNGVLEYDVPLATGEFKGSAWKVENLATKAEDSAGPAVHVKDPAGQAVLDIRMPSSYVYLTGELAVTPALGDGGQIKVLLSDNNGLDWKEVTTLDKAEPQKIDISKLVLRRYSYIVRFVMKGKGTGLDALKITHDVQCSQRALPALDRGENKITFSSGNEGTVSIEGNTEAKPADQGKQLTWLDFHPQLDGFTDKPRIENKTGSITYTVQTPGEMSCLRVSDHFTSGRKDTMFLMEVSFDGGKNWRTVDEPTPEDMDQQRIFIAHYVKVTDIPAGTRSALVRYRAKGTDTLFLTNARIDADYKEPAGGFRPVKVTYLWEEGGIEKKDEHTADKPNDTWTIKCEGKPALKSITLELAK